MNESSDTNSHRRFHLTFLLSLVLSSAALEAQQHIPNFVIILADDLGYADTSPYGAKIRTPNLARMAKEGVRFTDFYVAQPVCSASRTALLTGCYPNRIGILGALSPYSKEGIHSDELTLAEVLKTRGCATATYGKWHLGYQPQFLPTRHGFDDYFGLPYSNDMWPKHPAPTKPYPPLPLIEGERTIETGPDQNQLTTWYTHRALGLTPSQPAKQAKSQNAAFGGPAATQLLPPAVLHGAQRGIRDSSRPRGGVQAFVRSWR